MSAPTPGLTVLVPCFNEGRAVRRLHSELDRAFTGIDLEILLIDNGSTDDTLAQIRSLAVIDPRVRYLSIVRNHGLEPAQSAGFRYASRPWIAQLDCDLQFPPSEVPKLLAAAGQGYDVVFGIRARRHDPGWRRLASRGQSWLARRGFGIEVPPGATMFRVVRTAVARTVAEMWQGTPYFIATVARLGVRYTCVPVEHRPRTHGRSRFRVWQLVGHTFDLLFGHSWRPLNGSYLVAALGVAAALALAGLAAAGLAGPTPLAAGALLLAAITLAMVALLGRYLHRLLRDLQPDRPYYIREANVPLRPEDRLDGGQEPVPPPQLRTGPAGTGAGAGTAPGAGPLLVLGAGEGQLPLYLEARRRGIPTIAVDRDPDALALPHATEHLPVSVRDPAAIIAGLGDRVPASVLAGAGEQATWSWYELSAHYRTPYRYPRSAAVASTDKGAFHATAEKAGVNTYRWRHDTDLTALASRADEIGYPLVAKPADGAGKKGLTLVDGPAGLAAGLAHAAAHSAGGGVVIEQRLTGRDLTVDVFMRAGEPAFTAVHEKIVEAGWAFRVRGHVTPAPLDPATHRRLVDTAVLLCQEIGLTDGPADFDAFLAEDGDIQVVEVNARLPGEAVPPLLQAVYGVDIVGGLVRLALGEPVELRPRHLGAGIVHTLASPLRTTGRLREVRGLAAVREMPGVAQCQLYLQPGAEVPPFPRLGNEVGYLLVTGADLAEARARLAAAMARLDVVLEPVGGDPDVA